MPLNEGHERFEEELGAVLRRTGEGFATDDSRGLVAGGLARGRRRLVRRRVGAITGSVLALAVVAAGGAYGGGLLGRGGGAEGSSVAAPAPPRDGGGQDGAGGRAVPVETHARDKAAPADNPTATAPADGPTSTAPAGKPEATTPADKPGATAPGTDTAPPVPSGQGVTATLRSLLPKGLRVTSQGGDGEYGYVVVDDGKGKSLVQVNVQHDMGDQSCALYCEGSTTLPDGGFLKLTQQRGEKGGAGVVWWSADTMDKDGFRVVVSAFNSGAQNTKATRAEPALTMAQLKAIVLDPKWTKTYAN
ncbi:hypothetical protein AB0D99_21680 [Streptomyces sp. NPDC047971]|uniref:hypothetical protein n=1 Tax=Streptomyces sp. NPDC047971 TaxID=3154499 RepID=UPI0033C3E8DD